MAEHPEQKAINRRRAIDREALLETSPFDADGGEEIGKDPRSLTPGELKAAGLEKIVGMRAIRAKCLDCCGYNPAEVRKCIAFDCALWALRMGSNPWNAKSVEPDQHPASEMPIAG